MKTKIETIQQFVNSLSPAQSRFFIRREVDIQARLQTGLREFCRGTSEISALNDEALAVLLSAGYCAPVSRTPQE